MLKQKLIVNRGCGCALGAALVVASMAAAQEVTPTLSPVVAASATVSTTNIAPDTPVGSSAETAATLAAKVVPPKPVEQPKIVFPDPTKVKSIVDLQLEAKTTDLQVDDGSGKGKCHVHFTNLNPRVNIWFVLRLKCGDQLAVFHLENKMAKQQITLDKSFADGLIITGEDGSAQNCELWPKGKVSPLKVAVNEVKPFVELCQDALYLRNSLVGRESTKEWVVGLLRDRVWGGEQITNFFKETVYKDSQYLSSQLEKMGQAATVGGFSNTPATPPDARIDEKFQGSLLETKELGISLQVPKEKLEVGKWYQTKLREGVFLSVIEAGLIHRDILNSSLKVVGNLEGKEERALDYLVAFDLNKFSMGFALGTDHPRVDWSERVNGNGVRNDKVPGPDGIGDVKPLVFTGSIAPHIAAHAVATFTGGFKRSHGAFKWGDLALTNGGSHYGFIENGVVVSRLQPGLATLIIYRDGKVDLKTWQEKDNSTILDVRFARQNGVPLIDYDPIKNESFPGALVRNWGQGNWSGSTDQQFRSLRAGVCLIEKNDQKFLVYGYFSSVTPPAMTRVFQAYGCKYAFHLDMNALEHTYLALYSQRNRDDFKMEHLITGMNVLDKNVKGTLVPRFIGLPDNRDFFYLFPKQP